MIRSLKASILVAIVAAGFVGPADAQARRQEFVIVYYDNDNHDHMVGQHIKFCDGGNFYGGTATIYDEETYYGCD